MFASYKVKLHKGLLKRSFFSCSVLVGASIVGCKPPTPPASNQGGVRHRAESTRARVQVAELIQANLVRGICSKLI